MSCERPVIGKTNNRILRQWREIPKRPKKKKCKQAVLKVHPELLLSQTDKFYVSFASEEKMVNFTCDQCEGKYPYRGLDRLVRRNHTAHSVFSCDQCVRSFARSNNLEKDMRTCTGARVAEYKLRKTRISL